MYKILGQEQKKTFNLEILNKLGQYHKNLMHELEEYLNNFESNKDLYNYINNYFKQNNLKKAFPIGISINHVIAHDSFHESNEIRLKKGDFIKIDIGMIELGNIIDSARTFIYKSNVIHKSIIDCELIAKSIEETICKDLSECKSIMIQKISALTNSLISMKGYKALDFLGGHTIEYGKVHGEHYILNKPLKLLPPEAKMFINPSAEIGEGEMFAIEIYIGEIKSDGNMIKSTTIPVTHYQINTDFTNDEINKLSSDEKKVFDDIKKNTCGLVYEWWENKNYNPIIIKKLIDTNYIIKHEALEFKSNSKEKIKYVQYEDCFIIKDNKLINLSR
jgi:methionyl aminopeptidase